jgi:hypothetical protein
MKPKGIEFLLLSAVLIMLLVVVVINNNAILTLLTLLISLVEVYYTKKQYDLERKKEHTKVLRESVLAPLKEIFHNAYINDNGNLVISTSSTGYELQVKKECLNKLSKNETIYPILAFIQKVCRETTNKELPITLVYDLLENHSPRLKELFWNVILSHNASTVLEQIRYTLVELTSKDIFLESCHIPNEKELEEKAKKYEHLFTLSKSFLY